MERKLLLGNEAIARGLIENGCAMATSYPGTPASEILAAVAHFQRVHRLSMHTQWAVNEKVALEIAYAGAQAGLRTAVVMKQVGLNVASDPLMSAAYMGTCGGFVVISADDPGPHSSQTEQDSRMMAMMAKIPVLDPESPRQARDMIAQAFDLSEVHAIPVMLRPTTRVCHARQDVDLRTPTVLDRPAAFEKDPARWAATPKFRQQLHHELEAKLAAIAQFEATAPQRLNLEADGRRAVVVSGVASAHTREIVQSMGLWKQLPLYQVLQPYPLHQTFINHLREAYTDVLVIEETTGVIEMQVADRDRVQGKLAGRVPAVGELTPEVIARVLARFVGRPVNDVAPPVVPGRRPTLCAGCPHRASFFAIKKAARKAIYTSDIGCYTLGLNLGAVDTVLCMGAAISQAAGFYHAYKHAPQRPDIVATIGDSTFFHAGLPALVDAVNQDVRFVLVILDNRTTAMTGNQPTPATGLGAGGEVLQAVDIETAVRGCGIDYVRIADPYRTDELIAVLKAAVTHSRETGPAVVISRYPCVLDKRQAGARTEGAVPVITDECDGCGYCVQQFECPAIALDEAESRARIDKVLCSGCGVCLHVCPKESIQPLP
ncbi:MAG: thiamine pyrophosphate-dependent enzyme [Desulfobacterales bacterium]|nr:thiamine pyrophosphate-dependent enzyme [Desulfobacterales bacterium]